MASYKITETRRQRTTRTGFGASNNRSTLGYWIPLALTVTAATVGIAAWIWSERGSEDDESSSEEQDPNAVRPPGYGNMSGGLPPGPGPGGYQGPPHPEWQGGQPPAVGGFQGPPPFENQGGFQDSRDVQSRSTAIETIEESSLVSRMSNALGIQRAPSPGQAYNWASRNISAGVTAAGAVVGGAITSFSGETKEGFDEHERWSEEADQQRGSKSIEGKPQLKRRGTAEEFYSGSVSLPRSASLPSAKRRTVALVVSSVQNGSSGGETDIDGHSSILAHLPEYINQDTTRIFVLIYAPTLETHPLSPLATGRSQPSQSMASSFSNISAAEAMTPGSFDQHEPERSDGILSNIDPKPIDETTTTLYKSLHNHALSLVDKDTMIMPFTSPQGHKHIIKSLQPEIVYMQEGLCGSEGEIVSELSGWVRTCVVVIGDEGGTGGLIDTDDEAESRRGGSRDSKNGGAVWWKREDRTGLGRGVEVVEALKIGEDWRRRVNAED